jgi:hypothetical protein
MAPRSASEKVGPKKSYFSTACEYVKLPFSLRVTKKISLNKFPSGFLVCWTVCLLFLQLIIEKLPCTCDISSDHL